MKSSKNSENLKQGFKKSDSPCKSLFLGILDAKSLFPFPKFNTSEAETITLVAESIDKFLETKEKDFTKYDRIGEQPKEFIEELKQLGLFGLIIPEEHGGLGLSSKGYARSIQQLSLYDGSTSLTIGAHSSIGMRGVILFGTPEQKKKYLPKLSTGEMIAAFCLTEPGSGSDAASIKTNAKKDTNGNWILNGEKIWITNGAFADFFTVFARTDDSITAFLVERNFKGLSSGHKEDKMGIRASATTSIIFDNVAVPPENVLGVVGEGFKVAMAILNSGRTGLGGGCVGAMKRCLTLAIKQSKERKQFNQSISSFPLIKEKIAQMTIQTFATESVVHVVADLIDRGCKDYATEAAISKIFATESLWFVSNEALQIAGGNGFMREYPYEMIVRDSRINMIFEGTNEILRIFIALGGVKELGGYLKSVSKSFEGLFTHPLEEFENISEYAVKKVTQYTTLGLEDLPVIGILKDEATTLQTYANELSRVAETILKRAGNDIVNQQLTLKRLADITIDLFVGACVLSRTNSLQESKDQNKKDSSLELCKIFIRQVRRRVNQNLRRLERNEDQSTVELADKIYELERFPWDVLEE